LLLVIATTLASLAIASSAGAQAPVVITPIEWPKPIYPQIAESARVQGDVEVSIDVRADGSVETARAVSGPLLLRESAEQAARRTRFECRGCGDRATQYSLHVSFRLLSESAPARPEPPPLIVSPTQGWVTVHLMEQQHQIHVHYATLRVRAPECLYLWRCGSEWGGMADWHERAYDKRCLWLWKCGWSKKAGPGPQ
jgi:TonB family protein